MTYFENENMQLFKKRKLLYCVLVLLCVLWYAYRNSGRKETMEPFGLRHVVVHLDFKGAPPKLSYLTSILPILMRYGANALLIEYEDMFPFTGRLANLSASNAYSRPELEKFLRRAVQLGFDIIPLVQTFGHMQYVLKHQQYEGLREDIRFTHSICPSQERSKSLIKVILNQIVTFHMKITPLRFIHIGCDEVDAMNECHYCRKRNLTKIMIFHQHVRLVYDFVQNAAPGTEVLIWDDMLRGKDQELFKPMHLPVDLVCWYYHMQVDPSHIDLYKYKKNYNNIWAASAFKGADGDRSILPNLVNRIQNHFSWMQFLESYRKLLGQTKTDFRGIILTGWSRYTHDKPVCDMLPASLPSLITNLILIQKFNTQPMEDAPLMTWGDFYKKYLKTDTLLALKCDAETNEVMNIDGKNCLFQGSDLNFALKTLENFKINLRDTISGIRQINNTELKENKVKLIDRFNKIKKRFLEIEHIVDVVMSRYFSEYVIMDYLKQVFDPIKSDLDNNINDINFKLL